MAFNMRGRVENVEEGAYPESPLKPLKNRLCLIKALGLPLRIEDEEGTIVTNKRAWACFAVSLLSFLYFIIGWIGRTVMSPPEMRNKAELHMDEKGIRKWDLNCSYIFYSLFGLLPFVYLYFYRGLGHKFEKFIETYQCTFINLKQGEEHLKLTFEQPITYEFLSKQ